MLVLANIGECKVNSSQIHVNGNLVICPENYLLTYWLHSKYQHAKMNVIQLPYVIFFLI